MRDHCRRQETDVHGTRATPDAGNGNGSFVPFHEFSTESLPGHQQFEAFCDAQGAIVDRVPGPNARAGFVSRQRTWHVSRLAIQHGVAPTMEWARTAQRARRDSLDHWLLIVHPAVVTRARFGEDTSTVPAGLPYLISLQDCVEFQRPGGDWVSIFLPRDAFSDIAPLLDAARGRPMASASGRLLGACAAMLPSQLAEMPASEADTLADAFRALVVAAASVAARRTPPPLAGAPGMRLARVRRLIAENLASARLGPELLCRSEGISRASLYRMFEPFGGVAAHILDVRLAYVHRALSDPTDERSISAIAESAGFFDASSLSRAFRRKYQCSPREFRLAALHGLTDAHADPLWPTSPTSLTGLLARL